MNKLYKNVLVRIAVYLIVVSTVFAAPFFVYSFTRAQIPASASIDHDFWLSLAKGDVGGHTYINKFGENPDIDQGAGFEDVWSGGGTYVPPTQARIHNVASSDVDDAGTVLSSGTATGGSTTALFDTAATFSDDTVAIGDTVINDTKEEIGFVTAVVSNNELSILSLMRNPKIGIEGAGNDSGDAYRIVELASTGAPIFYIMGLDASFLEHNEFVVLNGQSNVATTNSYVRQFRARVFGAPAEGTISSTAVTDGTITCQVTANDNQTLMAIYTIPFGKIGYVTHWWGSINGKKSVAVKIRLRVGQLAGVPYTIDPRGLNGEGASSFSLPLFPPRIIPGGADVWIDASSDTADTIVASGFTVIIVEI